MASLDVRHVLNLPAEGASRPRKSRTAAPRQTLKGLAREVQSLGGDNPIAIVPAAASFKKRRLGQRKPAAKWKLVPFTNSAREGDPSLTLRHWARVGEAGATAEQENPESAQPGSVDDSAFAKFNVQVQVPQYSEDQYNSNLQNPNWTKHETDHLIELARDFDLRWSIIWDRYEYRDPAVPTEPDSMAIQAPRRDRDIDALKARYYEVAAKMMAAQTPVTYMPPQQQHLHNIMANYSPQKERARRKFAEDSLSRSKDEAKEEESLLLEVKRILGRAEQLNGAHHDLYARLDYPSSEVDQAAFKTSAGLQKLLQNLMDVDKTKKRKSMLENGVSPGVQTPVAESTGSHGHNRRDSTASGHGRRDSASGDLGTPTSTTRAPAKKGSISLQTAAVVAQLEQQQQQQQRRRLTDMEELVYGVSHHDRLASGATFRYDKINKLFSHKSGQQQTRITNVLTELGIPPRLQMPTSAVVSKFEALITGVNALLDARKHCDKVEAEVRTEMAKRQIRLDAERAREAERMKDDGGAWKMDAADGNEDGEATIESKMAAPSSNIATEPSVKEEAVSRPGSSGHKRSASVMSAVGGENAAKRQKK